MNIKEFNSYFGNISEINTLEEYKNDPEFKSIADRLITAATGFLELINGNNPNRLDFAKNIDDKASTIEINENSSPEEKIAAEFINSFKGVFTYLNEYTKKQSEADPNYPLPTKDSFFGKIFENSKKLVPNIKQIAKSVPEADAERKAQDLYNQEDSVYLSDDKFSDTVFSQKSTDKEKLISLDIFPNDGPKPEDIIQSQNGACFLLSSLRMKAMTDPQSIKDLIEDNGDGTVTVHFSCYDKTDDSKKKPFNVRIDKTVADWDQKSAVWVKLVEKAFAAANVFSSLETGNSPNLNALINQEPINIKERIRSGGDPWALMSVISPKMAMGSHFKQDEICSETTKEGVINKFASTLQAAFENKQPVSVNFSKPAHAVLGTGISQKKGKFYLDYFDQQAQKSKSVSLEDVFENKNKNIMGISIFPRYDAKEYHDYCHVFHPSEMKSFFERNNMPVTKDSVKDAILDEFVKRTDVLFQYGNGHYGFTDIKLKSYLGKDDAFFQGVFDKLDKNMRVGDFKNLISKADSEIMFDIADKYKGAKVDYKTDASRVSVINFLSKGRDVFVKGPSLKQNAPEMSSEANQAENKPSINAADAAKLAKMKEARESIKSCAKYLESVKTFKNSEEYRDLITTMNTIADDKSWRNMKPETAQKLFANQLTSIYSKVDKYLEHKSKDGVNKNAYKKLYAVEKTSQMLKGVMNDFGNQQVTIGKTQLNLSNIAVDYNQQAAVYNEKYNTKMAAPKKESNRTYENAAILYMVKNEGKLSPNLTKEKICDVIENVDTCMCKIILKAQKNNQSLKAINTLKGLRQDMIKEPFPPIKDAPEVSQQKEVNQNIL